ncbi:hypothetical protein [Pseudorhodoferax sp. Leaf265]|uniref:hypothetical protein n=1 Tax=Pseudorhodoferax sp. Leaf265 TaxID=1736315 RepID=UPI0006F2C94F|nr:hypothetical protein [Pseudorhodoferax sp. Leaf265]KQP14482.1 hypothetical protein ASF45_29985 [Pseudorhodoferax sp. Leaf265]
MSAQLIDPTAKATIRITETVAQNVGLMVLGQCRKAGDVVEGVPLIDALAMQERGRAVIVRS